MKIMRNLLKLSALSFCALSLSACALTQNVAQDLYDNEAEKNCRTQSGEAGSIHKSAKSNCMDGIYAPKPKDKTKSKPRKSE